jgi:hypothetical protein
MSDELKDAIRKVIRASDNIDGDTEGVSGLGALFDACSELEAALAAREADGGKAVELPPALVVTAEGSHHDYYADGWNDCRRKVRELAAREPAPGLHMSQHDMNVTPIAQAVAVPDGFVMVPVEPTDKMVAAAKAVWPQGNFHREQWRAMLAAAKPAGGSDDA